MRLLHIEEKFGVGDEEAERILAHQLEKQAAFRRIVVFRKL